jgi:hypothetical protein
MGSIKSVQASMGYAAPAPSDMGHCQCCAYQTWTTTEFGTTYGRRLPYCQMGGFLVWLDSGCVAGFKARPAGDLHPEQP